MLINRTTVDSVQFALYDHDVLTILTHLRYAKHLAV